MQSDERVLKLLETFAPAEDGMHRRDIHVNGSSPFAKYPIGSMHQGREDPFWYRRIDGILHQGINRLTMYNAVTGINADSAPFRTGSPRRMRFHPANGE